jgi:nicotinamidase-related amidase
MGKKILVVVDYQYDFFNPDGALYVNGAEKLYDKIMNIIPNFDHVIFTQDWHPFDHCSFTNNGGIWPVHCVAGTIGAGIPVEFMKLAKSFSCCTKGEDESKEEYGAFSNARSLAIECDYDFEYIDFYNDEFIDKSFSGVKEIVVCGIAGDYCVLETLKNIIKHIGANKVSVYLDGIVSIDGGEKLNNFIKENNIKTY